MEDITNQKRLELITEMIGQAKSNFARKGSAQILLWGWVIALANLGHFLLSQVGYFQPHIVWWIVLPATLYSIYLGRKMASNPVRSHLDGLYGQVWIAVAVVIVITLMMMYQLSFYHNPVILATAGAGMFITGSLLRYKPIYFGAAVLWMASLLEWQMDLQWHYLISAIAIFMGYLVPGYLLKRSESE